MEEGATGFLFMEEEVGQQASCLVAKWRRGQQASCLVAKWRRGQQASCLVAKMRCWLVVFIMGVTPYLLTTFIIAY